MAFRCAGCPAAPRSKRESLALLRPWRVILPMSGGGPDFATRPRNVWKALVPPWYRGVLFGRGRAHLASSAGAMAGCKSAAPASASMIGDDSGEEA